jgi:hypothetical protein
MPGFSMGWETLNLKSGGINRVVGPSGGAGPVHSVQVGLKLSNSALNSANQTGRAVALVNAWITPTTPTFGAVTPQATQSPFLAPNNSDWGSASIVNPNGYNSSGSGPQGWGVNDAVGIPVFSITMECQLPAADIYRDQIFLPPNTIIPAGSFFVLHVDALTIPAGIQLDFESQGVIFYG